MSSRDVNLYQMMQVKGTTENMRQLTQQMDKLQRKTADVNQGLSKSVSIGMNNFIKGMEDITIKGKSFKHVLQKTGEELLSQVFENMMRQVYGQIGNISVANMTTSTSSNGGIWSGIGSMISGFFGARASGGLVQAGQAVLVGENGPEIFAPGRTSGTILANQKTTSTNQAVQVNVVNNAQAQVQVAERQNSRGQKEVEIQIDQMVANVMAEGAKTRGVMKNMFGIQPMIARR